MSKLKDAIRNELKKEPVIEKVPSCLVKRFRSTIIISICTILVGILMLIMNIADATFATTAVIIFIAVGAAVLLYAIWFWREVRSGGYREIKGEVTFVRDKLLSGLNRKDPTSLFHITDDKGVIYNIPAQKGGPDIQLHAKVSVYCPKGAHILDPDGVKRISAVWGYEINEEPTSAAGTGNSAQNEEEER